MKKGITVMTLVVVMALLLDGCGGAKDSLLGIWTTTIGDITFSREFKNDGTVIERVNNMPLRMEGNYTTDDDKIIINMTYMVIEESGESIANEVDWEYSYSVKGNKLILIDLNLDDAEEITYIKE